MSGTANVIGKVLISQDRPATATEFYIAILKPEALEVGTYVVVEDPQLGELLCIVESVEYAKRSLSLDAYIEANMLFQGITPSQPPEIYMFAKVRVIARERNVKRPPISGSDVRLIKPEDVNHLMARDIPENKRVLMGFIKGYTNDGSSWIPVYGHSDYICGPEGAHVNISGLTGLAAKTSYAVFLAYSILAQSLKEGVHTAIILFNVKRGDLLRLHRVLNLPQDQNLKLENIKQMLENWARRVGVSEEKCKELFEMWQLAIKDGVDPSRFHVRYFTYRNDPYLSDPQYLQGYNDIIWYRYGLGDLEVEDLITALYRPNELGLERQIGTLYTYFEEARSSGLYPDRLSFDDMLRDFRTFANYYNRSAYARAVSSGRCSRARVELDEWHQATVAAIYRRLRAFLSRAQRVILPNRARGYPITVNHILPNALHVIQLYGLDDSEKRLVVNVVLKEIARGLEQRNMPSDISRVCIIADELNKYAPKRESPIKEQLIDIAARGRDIRLSLIGIEQFASDIDEEIYGNCGTKVVGRSEVGEVNKEIYGYLGREFRSIAPSLEKGEALLFHPLYPTPFVIRFPVPLHHIL